MLTILRSMFRSKDAAPEAAVPANAVAPGGAAAKASGPAPESVDSPSAKSEISAFVCRDHMFDRSERIRGYEFSLDRQQQSRFADRSPLIRRVYDDALLRELAASRMGDALVDQVAIVTVAMASMLKGVQGERPRSNTVLMLDPLTEVHVNEPAVHASIDALSGEGVRVGWTLRSAPEAHAEILARCEFVQIETSAFDGVELKEMARKLRRIERPRDAAPLVLVARDVQTSDDYQFCARAGFDHFLGPFATKRENWVPPKSDVDRLRVFRILNLLRQGADNAQIADAVRTDPVLTFKLLRYVNSAATGLSREIATIDQALVVIGAKKLYRWLSLLVFDIKDWGFAERAMVEQVLVRARLMELLATGTLDPDPAFLTGLLSMLDQFLGRPIVEVLPQITVPDEVKDALLSRSGPYAPLLAFAQACEQGDQEVIATAAAGCGLDEAAVNAQLLAALQWAQEVAAVTQ